MQDAVHQCLIQAQETLQASLFFPGNVFLCQNLPQSSRLAAQIISFLTSKWGFPRRHPDVFVHEQNWRITGWCGPPVQVLSLLVVWSRLLYRTGRLDQVDQALAEF